MNLDQETEIPQAEGSLQQNAYPPSVSNITQEINNHTPVWRVILLFLIFQPIALFIIFKEKYYHGWIAFLLWLHAIPLLIVYIIMKISVLPQLESLYKNLNLTGSFPIINLLLIVFIIFMLAQIIFGIFVFYKNRLIGYLSNGFLAATLVFFIIDLFISPAFIIISLLNPLYSLISSVEKQTTIETFQLTPTPTPDPTANWKTHNDNQNNYAFKYPLDWNQCNQNEPCVKSPNIEEKFVEIGEGGKMVILKGGQFIVTKIDRTEEMKLNDSCQPGGPINIISCNLTIIDGKQAMKRVQGNPENSTTYFILTEKYYYAINLFYPSRDQKTENTLDQILQTFQFAD